MSRPSATRPGGTANARCRSSSAARTGGKAATLEASFPADSVRMSAGDLRAVQPDDFLAAGGPSRSVCQIAAASRLKAATSSKAPPCAGPRAPPVGTVPRYPAALQPRARATARLTVPLPDPEGPSMVMTGAWLTGAHPPDSSRSRPDRARECRRSPERRSRHWRRRAPRWDLRRANSPRRRPWRSDGRRGCRPRRPRTPAPRRRPWMRMPSGVTSCSTPSAVKPAPIAAMRSLSFTRNSSAPRDHRLPLRTSGGDEQHRKLVDGQRHQRRGHRDAVQHGAVDPQVRRQAPPRSCADSRPGSARPWRAGCRAARCGWGSSRHFRAPNPHRPPREARPPGKRRPTRNPPAPPGAGSRSERAARSGSSDPR